jgi:anti-sigma regulatory factor (Ser/Thr protein kinase)
LGAADYDYDEQTLTVPMGSVLILYTDGLVESRHRPLTAGLRSLATSAAAASGGPALMCEQLLQSILGAGQVNDDVAILAVGLTATAVAPLTLDLPATADVLGELRAALRPWLAGAGIESQAAEDVVVAVSEAATNVVEHAYPEGNGKLEVTGQRVAETVTVTVRDWGRWQPPATADQGRGLLLMEALVDRLEVVHRDTGTVVHLAKIVH